MALAFSNDLQANMATGPSVMGYAKSYICLQTLMASIANGDLMTTWKPGYNFRITGLFFVTGVPVTTGSKLATLTPYIGTTALTGGVLALTSALCTPAGAVVQASAITGKNAGEATDTITLTWSAVTTFIEGSGSIQMEIENLDIPL